MIIYKVTNILNRKSYVGMTTQGISTRWSQHKSSASAGSTMPLHCSIRKYGIENFTIEQLSIASNIEDMCQKEVDTIISMNTLLPHGYNVKNGGNIGGNGGACAGIKWSEANKAKHSLAMKQRNFVTWNKGTKGLTKANKGSFTSDSASKEKNSFYGKAHKQETKKLISENNAMQIQVVDTTTGKAWTSIKQCWAENQSVLNTYGNFADQLRGRCKNKTVFKIKKDLELKGVL